MSAHIPGNDPNQNKAVWIGFVRNELQRTRYTVTFNGQEHSVYSDDIHLYVLDEWHGHLEVLENAAQGRADATSRREIH